MKRNDIIDRLRSVYLVGDGTIRITTKSYAGNMLAPEDTAYRVSFTDLITSKRRTVTLWPNTVGFQG